MATGALHEILDSDNNRKQDDLSSDDSCNSISDESCKEEEYLERQSVRWITQYVDSESGSVASSSVTESTERSSSSSLLSVLKAPKASDLARKHSVLRNLPQGKKSRGNSTNDPTNIKFTQRIKEYPNEPFVVSNSKLFCNGCHEELCIKKSSVENHIASAKHKKGTYKEV